MRNLRDGFYRLGEPTGDPRLPHALLPGGPRITPGIDQSVIILSKMESIDRQELGSVKNPGSAGVLPALPVGPADFSQTLRQEQEHLTPRYTNGKKADSSVAQAVSMLLPSDMQESRDAMGKVG